MTDPNDPISMLYQATQDIAKAKGVVDRMVDRNRYLEAATTSYLARISELEELVAALRTAREGDLKRLIEQERLLGVAERHRIHMQTVGTEQVEKIRRLELVYDQGVRTLITRQAQDLQRELDDARAQNRALEQRLVEAQIRSYGP